MAQPIITCLDMEGVCVSSGSACHADSPEPSHVLKALGRSRDEAGATVRFSFGPENTVEEVRLAAQKLKEVVSSLSLARKR